MLTADTKRRLDIALTSEASGTEIEQALIGFTGQSWFVDTVHGSDTGSFDGKSWGAPFRTMGAALTAAQTLDTIFFRGDVREELTGSNLKFDITIVGVGSQHHPDLPAAGYDPGASMWRPPTSPTASTPLLIVHGRGWRFVNVTFDAPVDAAAVKLVRNALSGTSEFDASHASFIKCRFLAGQNAIEDSGGCYDVTVRECELAGQTGTAIINTSTAVALPLDWKIIDNIFPSDNADSFGNGTHIDSPLSSGIVVGNVFGTVVGSGLYVDLTGGKNNMVSKNVCAGTWATADYKGGTSDLWQGNFTPVDASTAPVAFSIAVPD